MAVKLVEIIPVAEVKYLNIFLFFFMKATAFDNHDHV